MDQTIEDITLDPENVNRGTERGYGVIEDSLRQYGAGRPALVGRDLVDVAGNKTVEIAQSLGFEVEFVDAEPDELVVHQRTDMDLLAAEGDLAYQRASGYAVVDNRAFELSYNPDPVRLAELFDGGNVDLSAYYSQDDQADIAALAALAREREGDADLGDPGERGDWPVIHESLPQPVMDRYRALMEDGPGEPYERFARIIADAAGIMA